MNLRFTSPGRLDRHSVKGFTLVELLVVVTVIIVLLALLTPALDRAVYQAELATCGANLKGFTLAMQTYAMGNQRRYPNRGLPEQIIRFGQGPHCLANPVEGDAAAGGTYDMRPSLAGIIQINKMLNDPLTKAVDLEFDSGVNDTFILASYYMWFDWQVKGADGGPGMKKLGDRWTYRGRRYSLLVSDYDSYINNANLAASHPDDRRLWNNVQERTLNPFTTSLFTISVWKRDGSRARDPLDLNFGYADGSVRRLNEALDRGRDDRMDTVGIFHAGNTGTAENGTHIPRE